MFNSEQSSDSYDTFRGLASPCRSFRQGGQGPTGHILISLAGVICRKPHLPYRANVNSLVEDDAEERRVDV